MNAHRWLCRIFFALSSFGLLLGSPGALAAEPTPWQDLYRIPIPEKFPPRPRVFCTRADLARIRADLARGDAYTKAVYSQLKARAEAALGQRAPEAGERPTRDDAAVAALMAQVYAIGQEESYGRAARARLLYMAGEYPKLETTRGRGRIADITLREAPIAIDCSMAYDLIADAPFMSDADRKTIESDLLHLMAWECGHRCWHRDSSNWRTWAMAILASCGFAIGDRALVDEAVNGAWDPEREVYLYGAVQQIAHSIFSDGIHFERSVGYTYYLADAYRYVATAAKNSGIDIWHAEVPGILGPFVGSATHDEYGPAGPRYLKTMFDALYYLSFADRTVAVINDSGTGNLTASPVFMHLWQEYRDPKFAWLINREESREKRIGAWKIWTPAGRPEWESTAEDAHGGARAIRLKTDGGERIALVRDAKLDLARPTVVTGWVKAVEMGEGASAHLRLHHNLDKKPVYSNRVTQAGDWTRVEASLPVGAKWMRVVAFLEGGAGEVLWDDIELRQDEDGPNMLPADSGFEIARVDRRPLDFWHLVHAEAQVPAGHFSLAPDATIGLTGRHENGCTLFPIGGFAVLRQQADNPEATGLTLTYGPYGNGHDHPDRLHVSLYGLGAMRMPDAGSWGYENPMHLNWANQTIAHNTVTIDETAQLPQGTSNTIWAQERDGMRIEGKLHLFRADDDLKVVRVSCDNVYPGCLLDRTLCLIDGCLLDVFRVGAESEKTIDLPWHGVGDLRPKSDVSAATSVTFEKRGYAELKNPRIMPAPAQAFVADFTDDRGASVRLIQAPPLGAAAAQIVLADDPTKTAAEKRACVMARRRGKQALFVTLLEPHRGAPRASGLRVEAQDDAIVATFQIGDATHRLILENALDGDVLHP